MIYEKPLMIVDSFEGSEISTLIESSVPSGGIDENAGTWFPEGQ